MTKTEKIIQEYMDGLINSLNKGYKSVSIPSVMEALREIRDISRKEYYTNWEFERIKGGIIND